MQTEKVIRKLGGVCLCLSARLELAEERERGYLEALHNEKKKRKREQPFTEDLRVEEGVSVLFFSLSKVQRARELQDVKQAAKEQEARDKVFRAEARAVRKARKESEAQQRRDNRATRAEASNPEEALTKAQMERDREARKAQKQLKTESKASQNRPRGRPPNQKKPEAPPTVVSEPVDEVISVHPKSRNGRIVKKPVQSDELLNLDTECAPSLIRIGGHTQDVAQYLPDAAATINNIFVPGNLEAVNVTFYDGLYKVLDSNVPSAQQFFFGLNFGQDDVDYPVAELIGGGSCVTSFRIASYELGNEPDFYNVQRSGGWNAGTYMTQQEDWFKLHNTRITHPEHGWQLGAFAQEPIHMGNFSLAGITQLGLSKAAGNVKTLRDHTYLFSICDASRAAGISLPILMNHSNTLDYFSQWTTEIPAARSVGAKFVMGETGSVYCHAKDGVSNTLGAALWDIDFMLHGAILGMQRVHFHMGTPFFYSMWQLIAYNGTAARPIIHELLALEDENLALYATYDRGNLCKIVVLNMEYFTAETQSRPSVILDVSSYFQGHVQVSRLTGPSSEETNSDQVTWDGQSYSTGFPKRHGNQSRMFTANSIYLAATEAVFIERA
ncbi:hypothetical protein LTR22_026338 [Elasticomyces elasticus]|nr:hypothetical protein LTR22_026338 [Elasticomyces elasticus]